MTSTGRRRTVLHGEQLEAAIRELNEFADDQAALIKKRTRGRVYRSSPTKPNVDALLEETLRGALQDEIVPAIEAPGSAILESELDQEVIKKALARLHADGLRQIARTNAIETTGGLEDLATRIGRLYRWDRQRIAELILENEPEPAEDRAHSERLYMLTQAPDVETVAQRLEFVLGRYIRTGIARWFAFEQLDADADVVTLRGTLRTYAANVTREHDEPSVIAVPRPDHHVEIEIDSSRVIRVRHANAYESSAAIAALSTVTDLSPLDYVPLDVRGVDSATSLAPASLLLLDLVTTRFSSAGLHGRNLTVARFRMDRVDDAESTSSTRPRLKAVRFEGTHILDSAPACKLLADEGRALVDVSMTVDSPPRGDGEIGRFPIRVALERDHVLALTGFGAMPGLSFAVHAAVVDAVRNELLDGLADASGLMSLANRIRERARSIQPVEEANMLTDEADEARDA